MCNVKQFDKSNRYTASNEQFGKMAAVAPQTILYEIQRLYPATTAVEAATSPSPRTLQAMRESVNG
jgi:hypothetical protein